MIPNTELFGRAVCKLHVPLSIPELTGGNRRFNHVISWAQLRHNRDIVPVLAKSRGTLDERSRERCV